MVWYGGWFAADGCGTLLVEVRLVKSCLSSAQTNVLIAFRARSMLQVALMVVICSFLATLVTHSTGPATVSL